MLAVNEIKKAVPAWIIDRTQENLDKYGMGLYDAFEEAVRNYPRLKQGSKLWESWYYSEFAAYIPGAYINPEKAQREELAKKKERRKEQKGMKRQDKYNELTAALKKAYKAAFELYGRSEGGGACGKPQKMLK